MKAVVTIDTYFSPDDGVTHARYLPGDGVDGDMAETAVSAGWAELAPDAPPKTDASPDEKKAVTRAPENKGA